MAREMARSDLPTLVLAALSDAPRHGYAIAREIERRSDSALSLKEGTLYPALRALEQDGLIESRWENPESGPARRIYTLTDVGRGELMARVDAFRAYNRTVEAVLALIPKPSGGPDATTA